jgi:hypothetical protein
MIYFPQRARDKLYSIGLLLHLHEKKISENKLTRKLYMLK